MTRLNDQAMKFVLSVFEQSGAQLTPELSELIDLAFAGCDSQIVMQAALEATKQARGRITIADVQKQIDLLSTATADDHPSPEEAWALVPKSEAETTYLSDEMLDAIYRGDVNTYLERDDFIGAERTFKKLYAENVAKSRATGRKPTWRASVGHDPSLRVDGLEKAVSRGIISSEKATDFDPQNKAIYLSAEKNYILKLPAEQRKALTGRVEQIDQVFLQLVEAQSTEKTTAWKPEREPSQAELNDPHWQKTAAQYGISVYDFLVFPMRPEISKKMHEHLSKQYGFKLTFGD